MQQQQLQFLRGCYPCATQTIQSFKGGDQELLGLYARAQQELSSHLRLDSRPSERMAAG
jgi:hypothetical protein